MGVSESYNIWWLAHTNYDEGTYPPFLQRDHKLQSCTLTLTDLVLVSRLGPPCGNLTTSKGSILNETQTQISPSSRLVPIAVFGSSIDLCSVRASANGWVDCCLAPFPFPWIRTIESNKPIWIYEPRRIVVSRAEGLWVGCLTELTVKIQFLFFWMQPILPVLAPG